MFSLFVVLLSFSESLATKCLFKPTVIDMNPNVLKYYPFMINLVNVLEVVMLYLQKYVFQTK